MRILVIGAANQGKTEYAKTTFANTEITVHALHETVFAMLKQGDNPARLVQELQNRPDWLILCDEIGGGIVPADAFLREYRENVGRLCCVLAKCADVVIRVTCGMPQVLKGTLP